MITSCVTLPPLRQIIDKIKQVLDLTRQLSATEIESLFSGEVRCAHLLFFYFINHSFRSQMYQSEGGAELWIVVSLGSFLHVVVEFLGDIHEC